MYNSYKYGRYAALYSSLLKDIKTISDPEIQRDMRRQVNDVIKSVNRNGESNIDKTIIKLAEKYDIAVSDIAPYVSVPDSITKRDSNTDTSMKYTMSFDDKLEYLAEAQLRLDYWYDQILTSDLSDEEKIAELKEYKSAISKQVKELYADKLSQHSETKAG